jgi:DNA-binding PadR family transcriptional regulator
MLTQRLRTMTDQGLVTVKELPPPAARSVYAVTEQGRSVVPVLRALTRWGLPLLEEPDDDAVVRPWTAANAAVAAFYDEHAADGIDERYLLVIDGEEFHLSSIRGGGDARDTFDLTLVSAARVWIDIRQGRTTLQHAIKSGGIAKTGSATALANFARVFQFR